MAGEYDAQSGTLTVRCQRCSRQQGRDVYHRYDLRLADEQHRDGTLPVATSPSRPLRMTWRPDDD